MPLDRVEGMTALRTTAKGDCIMKKLTHGGFTCHGGDERKPNSESQVVRPQLNGACMLSGSQLKCLGLDQVRLDQTNSYPVLHALPDENEEQPDLVNPVSIKF